MAGIGIIIPGTGPGTGPIIPLPLHSPGVEGYSRRFAAERLDVGAFTSWPDAGAAATPLAIGSTSVGTVTVRDESGLRMVRLDNATTGAGTILTDGVDPGAGSFTFAAVARLTASVGTDLPFYYGGARFSRPGSAALRMEAFGTGAAGQLNVGSFTVAAWHLILGVIDIDDAGDANDGPAVRLDGGESTTVTSGPFTPGTTGRALIAQALPHATIDSQLDIVEIVVWPRVLVASERAAVRTALKNRYSVLP